MHYLIFHTFSYCYKDAPFHKGTKLVQQTDEDGYLVKNYLPCQFSTKWEHPTYDQMPKSPLHHSSLPPDQAVYSNNPFKTGAHKCSSNTQRSKKEEKNSYTSTPETMGTCFTVQWQMSPRGLNMEFQIVGCTSL